MHFENTLEFAALLDAEDKLNKFQSRFYFPQHNNEPVVYFTGNSLGLQPKTAQDYIQQELNDWAKFGVEGHFDAKNPWFSYHEMFAEPLAKLVGALPSEVVAMNALTVNLHLLMASFYQPKGKRTKILTEAKAFPSDQYAVASQIQFHGLSVAENLIEVAPREAEYLIREDDIIATIEKYKDELALVMIGGVNYFTGQFFDLKKIREASHQVGAFCGFDLAHAAGNVELKLHEWNVDFACWCSYKYLNSGPGGVSGIFVHQKHHQNNTLPKLAGWWGQNKSTRFLMEKDFDPIPSAESWQLSNAPVISMAVHKASLDIFMEAGFENLINKSVQLTSYLEFILIDINQTLFKGEEKLKIITPSEQSKRGCQLSIVADGMGKSLFNLLSKNGIIADWREPNVIRVAPVPLYNSFYDCWKFGNILSKILHS
jgi:kynureninase